MTSSSRLAALRGGLVLADRRQRARGCRGGRSYVDVGRRGGRRRSTATSRSRCPARTGESSISRASSPPSAAGRDAGSRPSARERAASRLGTRTSAGRSPRSSRARDGRRRVLRGEFESVGDVRALESRSGRRGDRGLPTPWDPATNSSVNMLVRSAGGALLAGGDVRDRGRAPTQCARGALARRLERRAVDAADARHRPCADVARRTADACTSAAGSSSGRSETSGASRRSTRPPVRSSRSAIR